MIAAITQWLDRRLADRFRARTTKAARERLAQHRADNLAKLSNPDFQRRSRAAVKGWDTKRGAHNA